MSGQEIGLEIISDTIPDNLHNLYRNSIVTILDSEEIRFIIRAHVIEKLNAIYVDTEETIDGVPVKNVVNELIRTLEVHKRINSDNMIYYEVGWFGDDISRKAIILEYGNFADEVVQSRSVIANIMLSQEHGSLYDLILELIKISIYEILESMSL